MENLYPKRVELFFILVSQSMITKETNSKGSTFNITI
uniref:Uncharacterized protein n=1 Tax=Lepeophtheirus salmonis TaxID=72036 RepID=A0A0K2T9D4_LEPSM